MISIVLSYFLLFFVTTWIFKYWDQIYHQYSYVIYLYCVYYSTISFIQKIYHNSIVTYTVFPLSQTSHSLINEKLRSRLWDIHLFNSKAWSIAIIESAGFFNWISMHSLGLLHVAGYSPLIWQCSAQSLATTRMFVISKAKLWWYYIS